MPAGVGDTGSRPGADIRSFHAATILGRNVMGLHTPLCDLLEVEHPIMLAGMGGVSYAELVAAGRTSSATRCGGCAS